LIEPASRPLPALRLSALDVVPVQADGQRVFCLRDRTEPGAAQLVVSQPALLLASLLDGQRTLPGVSAAFLLRTGARLSESEIARFVQRLDEANLLDSDGFRQRLEQQRRAYFEQSTRPAVHAEAAYPADGRELETFLDALYTAEDGPGGPPQLASGPSARALIAPHIDLRRGGPTYAWTYKALAEREPAELYLLLGTCHTPMRSPLAASRKPYETPLGLVALDHDFLDTLQATYPADLYEDEFSHRGEHSLEFQALYLRYLQRAGESAQAGIVPLLCGSLSECVPSGVSPQAVQPVVDAVAALRETLAMCDRRVCLIAGADLAHVGPQFGDPAPVTNGLLEVVGRSDAEMLELICRGEAEGFYQQVMANGDARRVCGLAPIYYLLSLIGPSEGRLLKYTQWVDPQGHGSVTFAGVIFEGEAVS
jgi:AmmeMemoRadiSam system protein B